MKPILFTILLLAGSTLVSGCLNDNVTEVNLARKRLAAAWEARAGQCDPRPGWILFIGSDVYSEDLVQCENSLLTLECPAEEIPPYCLWMMLHPASHPDVDGL